MYIVKRFSQMDPLELLQMEFARKDYEGLTDIEAAELRARRRELAEGLKRKRAAAIRTGGDAANRHIARQKGLLGKISDFFRGGSRGEADIVKEGARVGRDARNAEYEKLLKGAESNSLYARNAVLNGRTVSRGGTPVSIEHIPNGTIGGKPISQAIGSGSESAAKEPSRFSKALGYVKDSLGKDAWKKGTLGQRGVQAAALGALAYGGYKGYKGLVDSDWDDDEDED